MLKKEKKDSDFIDLLVDIGVQKNEDAERLVSVGDFAVFDTDFYITDNNESVFGKALDNRIGCFLLCKLISDNKTKVSKICASDSVIDFEAELCFQVSEEYVTKHNSNNFKDKGLKL